jgi:hypothetical protein
MHFHFILTTGSPILRLINLRSDRARRRTASRYGRMPYGDWLLAHAVAADAMNLRHSSTHLRQDAAHLWQDSASQPLQTEAHCSQISAQSSQIFVEKADPRDISSTHMRQMTAQSRHSRPQSAISGEPSQHW